MSKLAVFRHVPFESLGLLEGIFNQQGISFEYFDMGKDAVPESMDRFDGIVSMGGPMSANDPIPFLEREMAAIRAFTEAGKPVLGICLGSQIIAKALGAKVFRNREREIGWFPVEFLPVAADDVLFGPLQAPEVVFHWHGETFDLPDGAVWLARSERCDHQAYRYGRATYGLQFHLEVTPEIVADWTRQPDNESDVASLTGPIDPDAGGERLGQLATGVFNRWCALLCALEG